MLLPLDTGGDEASIPAKAPSKLEVQAMCRWRVLLVAVCLAMSPRLAAAQWVSAWVWAEPHPFVATDQITISVDASWDPSTVYWPCWTGEWSDCWAVAHEANVWGSDGFSDWEWDSEPWGWSSGYDYWQFWDLDGPALMEPIYYAVEFTVTYCDQWYSLCFEASTNAYTAVEPAPIEIMSDNGSTVWWFNGEDPDPGAFPTSITLTSSGGSQTQWTVWTNSEFGEAVELSSDFGEAVTVTANEIGSGTTGDMFIVASVGATSASFQVTARRPHKFEHHSIVSKCPHTYQAIPELVQGFFYKFVYTAKDQLNAAMQKVPYNEHWQHGGVGTNPPYKPVGEEPTSYQLDFTGSTWGFKPPSGAVSDPATGQVFDLVEIAGSGASYPVLVPPSCGGDSSVDSWTQRWFVGSQSPGQGVHVQNNKLHRYLGKAQHESVQSPVGGGG